MQGDGSQRGAGLLSAGGKPINLCVFGLALCLALSPLAGCSSIGQALGPLGPARADVSIAFESIDGVPQDVSQRLVRDLNEEAAAFRIAVLPAGGQAAYRMRGYLAAHSRGSTTSVAWAWDVYDAGLHRAFRLSGEELGGATAGRSPEARSSAMADDALLHRIARTGMAQLVDFMASAPVAPAPPAPERSGSVVAGRVDPRTDPALGFRGETAAAPDSAAVPPPAPRPARLADAASRR